MKCCRSYDSYDNTLQWHMEVAKSDILATSLITSLFLLIQSNPAISNSVNSKSPLFRRKIEFPWIYPPPLRFPGYFETPLFRTFFYFPWDFEIAGFDCSCCLLLLYCLLSWYYISLLCILDYKIVSKQVWLLSKVTSQIYRVLLMRTEFWNVSVW